MTSLWTALNEAARPSSFLHIQSSPGGTFPIERLLADAERTAGHLAKSCRASHSQLRFGILMANGESWLRGLFAAFRLGAVAVPLSLPTSPSGLDAHIRQSSRIIAAAKLDAILIDRSVAKLAGRIQQLLPELVLVDITEVPEEPAPQPDHCANADDLAIIQFTSGSTSSPKGVTLTNGNVLAGIASIIAAIEYTEHDRLGIWLPLFHDMGLFSTLTAFMAGASVWLWRPSDFIRNPVQWLTTFAAVRATTSPAPNFAFDYLAEAAQEGLPEGIDLSAWRLGLNGAEPVRRHTIEAFHRALVPHGLPPAMLSSCYGLAEATLMVTFAALRSNPRSLHVDRFEVNEGSPVRYVPEQDVTARDVVSVGPAAPGIEVRVGSGAGDGMVGEIQIRGAAVTKGYLDVDSDQQPFTSDGWLKTGDLGFADMGEFFIVGRIKNMIVVNGQNFYAEDIEELVGQTAGPAALRCAALPADDGTESMAVLMETSLTDPGEMAKLARTVEQAVTIQLSGRAVQILPVAPRSIPLTTSGKVKRDALRSIQSGNSAG